MELQKDQAFILRWGVPPYMSDKTTPHTEWCTL